METSHTIVAGLGHQVHPTTSDYGGGCHGFGAGVGGSFGIGGGVGKGYGPGRGFLSGGARGGFSWSGGGSR